MDEGSSSNKIESQTEMAILSRELLTNDKAIYKDEFKDKLLMSPIKKYSKYDKFPFKLVIHFALIVLTTIQL